MNRFLEKIAEQNDQFYGGPAPVGYVHVMPHIGNSVIQDAVSGAKLMATIDAGLNLGRGIVKGHSLASTAANTVAGAVLGAGTGAVVGGLVGIPHGLYNSYRKERELVKNLNESNRIMNKVAEDIQHDYRPALTAGALDAGMGVGVGALGTEISRRFFKNKYAPVLIGGMEGLMAAGATDWYQRKHERELAEALASRPSV